MVQQIHGFGDQKYDAGALSSGSVVLVQVPKSVEVFREVSGRNLVDMT
jgi:hypothetical protein